MINDIPELVRIVEVDVPVQTIVMNGQQQQIMGKACVMICPECNNIIQQYQSGVSILDVLKSLNTDKEEELNATIYCSKCGKKLKFMRPSPIDVEVEEIINEPTKEDIK